jgi:hypothetical protein
MGATIVTQAGNSEQGGASPALTIIDVLMSAIGAHKSWSILCTANGGGGVPYLSIRDIAFRTSPGGAHIPGDTIIKSSELGGFPATNAYDGNVNNAWASDGGAFPQRIGVTYNSPTAIIQVAITGYYDTNQFLKDYKIQYTDDVIDGNEAWIDTSVSIVGQTWSSNAEVKIHNMFPTIAGDIIESLSVSDWRAIIADAGTGALVGEGAFTGGSFSIDLSSYSDAVIVTVLPADQSDYGAAIAAYGPVTPS